MRVYHRDVGWYSIEARAVEDERWVRVRSRRCPEFWVHNPDATPLFVRIYHLEQGWYTMVTKRVDDDDVVDTDVQTAPAADVRSSGSNQALGRESEEPPR